METIGSFKIANLAAHKGSTVVTVGTKADLARSADAAYHNIAEKRKRSDMELAVVHLVSNGDGNVSFEDAEGREREFFGQGEW